MIHAGPGRRSGWPARLLEWPAYEHKRIRRRISSACAADAARRGSDRSRSRRVGLRPPRRASRRLVSSRDTSWRPVVPAGVLVELLAQAGGIAAASGRPHVDGSRMWRVAALGPFKFPGTARPHQILEAHARVLGRIGGVIKIEGEVLADGVRVAVGSVTLADVGAPSHASDLRAEGRIE